MGWFQLGAEPAFYAPKHSVLIFNPAGGVDVASGANLGDTSDFLQGLHSAYDASLMI